MRNHLPQLPAGAQRVEVMEYTEANGDKTHVALYQRENTDQIILIDSFRGGEWDSILVSAGGTDALRRMLNRNKRRS